MNETKRDVSFRARPPANDVASEILVSVKCADFEAGSTGTASLDECDTSDDVADVDVCKRARASFWSTTFNDCSALFAQDLIFDLLAGERGVLGGPLLLFEEGSDEESGCNERAR